MRWSWWSPRMVISWLDRDPWVAAAFAVPLAIILLGAFAGHPLLFLFVPGDPESGAVYILDRKKGTWYAVDFDDQQFGGYSVRQLEQLLKECQFLDLIERPGLWRAGLSWWVKRGQRPEARV